MIFGMIGKFSAIFIAIPEPVLGGALICITGVFIGKCTNLSFDNIGWKLNFEVNSGRVP